MSDEVLSRIFYVMKAMAIVSVAAAHCTYRDVNLEISSNILGVIGVPVFLILAGFYFDYSEEIKTLFFKKLKRIVVPWIALGGGTYFLALIFKKMVYVFDPLRLVTWILGSKTWLYFVPVLLFCYFLFRICNNTFFLVFTVFFSVISILVTAILTLESFFFLTTAQNPLNWIGFFAGGMLLKRYEKYLMLWLTSNLLGVIFVALFGISFYGYYFLVTHAFLSKVSYWTAYSIPFEIVSFLGVMYFAKVVNGSNLLVEVGKLSYFIFFTHMQIGNGIVKRFILFFNIEQYMVSSNIIGWVMLVARPAISVLLMYMLAKIIVKILDEIHLSEYKYVLGL